MTANAFCRRHCRPLILAIAVLLLSSAWFLPQLVGSAAAAEIADDNADAVPVPVSVDIAGSKSATRMVLGLSWQPGFCEGSPKKAECRNLEANAAASRQFSLNGLWRLGRTYCGIADAIKATDKQHHWLDLPEPQLDAALRTELASAMPGVASGLDRHEWIKHGSCSAAKADDYYRRSLDMLAEVNRSPVGALFAKRLGAVVVEADVREAFEAAFGAGAGDRVKMRCRKDGERQVITGISIGLGGTDDEALTARIAAAGPTDFGCAAGVVDLVGLQ